MSVCIGLFDGLSVCLLVSQSVCCLFCWSVGQSVSVCRSVSLLVGLSIGLSVGQFLNWTDGRCQSDGQSVLWVCW